MTLDEARTWMSSRVGERYLADLDRATDEAVGTAESSLRNMRDFPSSTVSAYRALLRDLERAQDAFNNAANQITTGRARDGRAVTQACRQYVAALVALEETNTRWEAFVDARVSALAAAFADAYIAHANAMRALLLEMQRELQSLRDDLVTARRNVDGASAQMILDATLAVVQAMLPEFALPTRVAIATGSVIVGASLDWALGPTGPSLSGSAVGVAGSYSDFATRLNPMVRRLASPAATLYSLRSDAEEIEGAERIVIDIQRRLRELERELPAFLTRVRRECESIVTARELYEGAVRRARDAAGRYRSSEGEYRDLMRQLASIR